ncbi:MAG TPA: triphosphoribosyl-dephospho-CoA synthase [Candidatus Acidoferrum sp.]|nr:triphosphoribosyl-dephospho-CoA synthase [Candidatus Acidoferrum sp.]
MRSTSSRCEEIAGALQLALLLEVSAYPKPGNVHRTQDFGNTRFEHFLASSVALRSHCRLAALGGRRASDGSIRNAELAIGGRVRRSVESTFEWQRGGNTSLGAILLLTPIACAAGMAPLESPLKAREIRKNLRRVVYGTTPNDAVNVYRAISYASPGGLGKVPSLDVNDTRSIAAIRKQNISLFQVFRMSSGYDTISSEWVNNFPVTFDIGLPFLLRELQATDDINTAVVDTYLKILSRIPDTLIARKLGIGRAKEVSLLAKRVLRAGGMKTTSGRESIKRMDRTLQRSDHRWNPGTTADLTASALSMLLLTGYRP